jgi:cephalosporin hydroxylase
LVNKALNSAISCFKEECRSNVNRMIGSKYLKKLSLDWICETAKYKYTYNFEWLGRLIIRFPHDILHKLQLELMLRML